MNHAARSFHASAGFSLIEIAVVLVILAILITAIGVPLGTQLDQQRTVDTQKQLENIKEALYGFAMANGRLPCPATAAGGTEAVGLPGVCTQDSGFVPGITLGLSGLDSAGFVVDGWRDGLNARRIRYAVRPVNTTSGAPVQCTSTLTRVLTTSDSMRTATMDCLSQAAVLMLTVNTTIITGAGLPGTCTASALSTKAPFVIFSLGKNGTTVGAGADETTNQANNAVTFISNTPTVAASCAGEFDDIVTWGSLNTLFARMVQAGKLP